MYTKTDYKTKKALKLDVELGLQVETWQPGPFPPTVNGFITLEGPHFPKAHTWYARCEVKNGFVVKGSIK